MIQTRTLQPEMYCRKKGNKKLVHWYLRRWWTILSTQEEVLLEFEIYASVLKYNLEVN